MESLPRTLAFCIAAIVAVILAVSAIGYVGERIVTLSATNMRSK